VHEVGGRREPEWGGQGDLKDARNLVLQRGGATKKRQARLTGKPP